MDTNGVLRGGEEKRIVKMMHKFWTQMDSLFVNERQKAKKFKLGDQIRPVRTLPKPEQEGFTMGEMSILV